MRQGQQNRRGRGRNRKGQPPISRNFESNGPDVKIRGTAAHVAEKYMALARDAISSGDQVLAENYLQHAEHYNRIIMAAQPQSSPNDPVNGQRPRRSEFDQPMFGDSGGDAGYDGPDEEGDEQPSDSGFAGEHPRFLDPIRYNDGPPEPRQGYEPRQHEPRQHEPRQHEPRQHEPRQQQDHAPRHQSGGYEPRYNQDGPPRQHNEPRQSEARNPEGRQANDQRSPRRRRPGRFDNGGRQQGGQSQGSPQDGGGNREAGGGEPIDNAPARSPRDTESEGVLS